VTVYHFEEFVVTVDTSGDVRASVGTVINVTDPATGLTPAGLTQGGVSVSNVVSGTSGLLEFQAGVAVVHLNSPSTGFDRTIVAQEQYGTGGSGVTDHGALTGLADDDHSQYAKVADAVPLSSATPLSPTPSGFAGTAASAARGDHRHPVYIPSYPIPTDSAGFGPRATPVGQKSTTSLDDFKAPLCPFPVFRKFTLVNLYVSLTTAGASGTFSLVVYGSDTTGLPSGAPLWQSADTSSTSTGIKTFSAINLSLEVGNYWLGFGGKGFGATRPRLARPEMGTAVILGQQWLVEVGFSPGATPGIYANDFNETTGAWPTTTPIALNAPNGNSIFWYSLTGTPAT
jgi:hypothetical protein